MLEITVNTNGETKEIQNFWNHIHFHPTDAIEDLWGQRILDEVIRDKTARMVRIYAMLEDIVSVREDGSLCYDYTEADRRMDYLVAGGLRLLVCFCFMPACIAKEPGRRSSMPRYKGKSICFSEPADYRKWQEICADFTRHVLKRYGKETVQSWYFHCWNEPDHIFWLNDSDIYTYDPVKAEAYCKLYDYFAAGVESVEPGIRIGGPSAAGNDGFLEAFAAHCEGGTNHVTGRRGSRLDFITMHLYSNCDYGYWNEKEICVENLFRRARLIHQIFARHGFGKTEFVVDEWGATASGFQNMEEAPANRLRETEFFPAFYAKLIDRGLQEQEKGELFFRHMLICLSGQHDLKKNFDGYRGFFTRDHYRKPIYNGYLLASKLGGEQLKVEFSHRHEAAGAVATRNGEDYAVMVYYTDETLDSKLPDQKIRFQLRGLAGNYRVRHYRIDHQHSNSYTAFLELGSPDPATQAQQEQIRQSGRLSLLYPEEKICLSEGYSEEFVMPPHSVSLIELVKLDEGE